VTVLQCHRLRRYGHLLQKDDNEWVKKCMEYEAEGVNPAGKKVVGADKRI